MYLNSFFEIWKYLILSIFNCLSWRDNPLDCSNHSGHYCFLYFWFWQTHFSFPNMLFHKFEFFRVFLEKIWMSNVFTWLTSSNLIGSLKARLLSKTFQDVREKTKNFQVLFGCCGKKYFLRYCTIFRKLPVQIIKISLTWKISRIGNPA